MSTSRIVVEGFVNKQIFPRTKVKSGDFAIFTFSPESVIGEIDNRTKNPKYKTDDITFKGRVPELDGGTRYKITADLKQDAKYGWQYDIVSINSVVKLDTEADVRKFLGYVFTENQINALYKAYPNPVEILERGDIEALCKIKGIKEAKATKLLNKYNASKDSSKAYTTLSEFGLSKATIDRLVEHYGSADILAEKVKNNPYTLIGEGVRIGWSKADSMALRKGIPTNSQFRINAYALYYLRNLAEVDGHTWVPLEALGSGIKGLSKDISTEMVKRELRRMVENKTLFYDKETKRIGLMKYRKLEEMICRELLRLQDAECRKMEFVEETIAECEETVGFQYTEEQKDAIRNLVNKNVILMTGNAGCVDKDTEFFDGTKWKKISEYESGDLVLQYNDDGTANLTKPLMYFKKPCSKFYHFETKYGLNQTVSEDHDMLYWTQNGVKKTDTIKKIIDTQTRDGNGFIGRFNTSFRYSGAGIPLTDEQIRVMCAVICDGSFYKKMENSPSAPSFNRCRFHIKKDRKKERLRQLFTDANIPWKESASAAQGYTDFYIQAPIKTKVFDEYWYACNNHQLQIICDEIMFWDGSEGITKNGVIRKRFSSNVKETAEFIQFAYSACGYRASIYTNDRRGQKYFTCGKIYERKSIEYNVIVTNRKFIGLCSDKRKSHCKTEISKVPSEDGYKYCFMVESTMLVLRRNGCIFISSNCGKSSLMYPVSRIFRKNGLDFEICALSGKASLNLHEITKEDGKTIHRLLGWNPKFGGPTFTKNNPLPTDVVVLDEVSMVGGELFYSLISAIKDGGRLIMLGDPGQLESIGLCNLISDLRNSGKITCVHLSKIFRQAKKSGIITDSLKVNAQTPIIPPKFRGEEIHGELKDLKIIAKSSSEECLEAIKKEFKRLRFDENIPIEDILILSAKRSMGDLSGRSINREIQSMIKFEDENPLKITYSDGIKYDVLYHVGDRVIVTKNNYEVKTPDGGLTEIFNGNIGTVVAKDNFRRQLIVRLAQGDVIIEGDMLLELQLGYAITCHKCISGETMIYTSDGYKSMKQFAKENGYEQVGDYEYTGNISVWTGESWEKPDCFYNVGKNSGYKILTEGNRSIAVTSDHKFLAKKNGDMQEKWYEAEDLCVGDYIKMTKEIPDFQSEYVHIPETFYNYKSDVRSVKYNLPKVIDEKFGLFLGMMIADGTVFKNGHGARFGKKQKEVVEKFVELVNYLFGYSCKIDYWDWANMYSAEIHSTYICGFLSQFDELLPNQKNIPKAIKTSPKSVQRAFMQGLMEDGAVHIKSGHFDMIEFYSCEKSIRDDLYFMLIQNGIHSSLFTRRAKGYCLYIYGEMAIEFKNKIGFIGKEKNKRLELISEKRCSKPYRTKDNYFVKIKNIEPTEVDAYCFKMPKEPQFVQNGFVGSNCQGSGIPYVIVACDPGAYQLLTKQWLYTALSRAKKYCVLVGTDKSINQCIKTDRVTRKSTWLSELLMFPERICCIRMTDSTQDERIQMDIEE